MFFTKMLCDFQNPTDPGCCANNGRFMLLDSILWNREFYWQTGGGVHRACPLCGARAQTKCLCARKSSFSPTDKLWKLELKHGIYLFTNGQMWNLLRQSYPENTSLQWDPRQTSGRWEGWAQTRFGVKQSLAFWPTPLHKKKIQVDVIFLWTTWDVKGDHASCSEPSLSCQ